MSDALRGYDTWKSTEPSVPEDARRHPEPQAVSIARVYVKQLQWYRREFGDERASQLLARITEVLS